MKKGRGVGIAVLLCVGLLSVQAYGGSGAGRLTTMTGRPGISFSDGSFAAAAFGEPEGIAVQNGTAAIADTGNNLIRLAAEGQVSTRAGMIRGRDAQGYAWSAYRDGARESSLFSHPADCDFYGETGLAVADRDNHAVRVVTDSTVYTLGGRGEEGYRESTTGTAALFSRPSGVAADSSGNVYVSDTGNHCIRMIRSDGSTSLVAGTPGDGGFQDGNASDAKFQEPGRLALAEDGTLYVCDTGNQKIRKIQNGQVTTLAGGTAGHYLDTEYNNPGYADGVGEEARFRFPQGICLAGNVVIVADTGNHVIRAIAPNGDTRTIAGTADPGFTDGDAAEALLFSPCDVAWENGVLYICDSGNSALRTMTFDPNAWIEGLTAGQEQ